MNANFNYRHTLTRHPDAVLIAYWNEQDGAASWLMTVESILNNRGYVTRNAEGHKRQIDEAPKDQR